MSTKTPQIDTGAAAPSVAFPIEAASKIRVWLALVLAFVVLVAYLDRVNVSLLIAFPRFL